MVESGTIITIDSLSKSFDSLEVLSNISLNVDKGKFISIVGPSGCGKSTLLRIIGGLEQEFKGKITIDGNIINSPHSSCGIVFQENTLLPWLSVKENICFALEVQNKTKEEIENKVKPLLELMGLNSFVHYYPHQLSGGMKRKAEIARLLAADKSILLLDEPFVSIDTLSRHVLQEELIDIWKKTKKTIVFVTHNVDEAVFLSNEIIVLSSSPASIIDTIKVESDFPRERTNPYLQKIRKNILDMLSSGDS